MSATLFKRKSLYQKIRNLFASGEPGWIFDNQDPATLFSDLAGTVPAVLDGPIGKQLDKSGRGNHRVATATANRPVWSGRYNLLTYTEQWDLWAVKNSTSITPNVLIAPNGTLTGDLLVSNTTNAAHTIGQTFSVVAGTPYDYVFRGKLGTARYVQILFGSALISTEYANFDLQLGTVTLNSGTKASISVDANGWYQCKFKGVISSGTGIDAVYVGIITTGTAARAEVHTQALNLGVWGADLRPTDQTATLPPYQWVTTGSGPGTYDTVGFPFYIKPNGTNQFLWIPSLALGTATMFVATGVRKISDGLAAIVVESSVSGTANNGTFWIAAPGANSSTDFNTQSGGTTHVNVTATPFASPITSVVTGLLNISAPLNTIRVNGTQSATSATTQGTGTFGTYPVYFFMRSGVNLPFSGFETYSVGRGGSDLPSVDQIAGTELLINSKTKAY